MGASNYRITTYGNIHLALQITIHTNMPCQHTIPRTAEIHHTYRVHHHVYFETLGSNDTPITGRRTSHLLVSIEAVIEYHLPLHSYGLRLPEPARGQLVPHYQQRARWRFAPYSQHFFFCLVMSSLLDLNEPPACTVSWLDCTFKGSYCA